MEKIEILFKSSDLKSKRTYHEKKTWQSDLFRLNVRTTTRIDKSNRNY